MVGTPWGTPFQSKQPPGQRLPPACSKCRIQTSETLGEYLLRCLRFLSLHRLTLAMQIQNQLFDLLEGIHGSCKGDNIYSGLSVCTDVLHFLLSLQMLSAVPFLNSCSRPRQWTAPRNFGWASGAISQHVIGETIWCAGRHKSVPSCLQWPEHICVEKERTHMKSQSDTVAGNLKSRILFVKPYE